MGDGDEGPEELGENLQRLEGVADRQGSWGHKEDLEGLEDNEDAQRNLVGNSWRTQRGTRRGTQRGHEEGLKDAAEGGAAPAPASAWPAREFSEIRRFFETMTWVHTIQLTSKQSGLIGLAGQGANHQQQDWDRGESKGECLDNGT